MEATTERLKRAVDRADKELLTALKLNEATDANIEHLLASYRSASEDLIFHNYPLAFSLRTEEHLWNWHTRINKRFRDSLRYFQDGDGKRKVVERRKSETQFIVFIKSSQSFYRAFLQRLASQFANVAEVVEVARKLTSDGLKTCGGKPAAVEEEQKKQGLRLCHSTLVQLGDLSRYRQTVLQLREKNWGPAKRYYRMAIAVLPTSGAPFHQLAVIAIADRDAFGITYLLYRALTQPELNLSAHSNLKLHFRKTRESWDKPQNHNVKDGSFKTFQSRFVAFHAKCYSGVSFEEHRDLEVEIIHDISVTLLQRLDASLLGKVCLTNIAAEATAHERVKTKCTNPDCRGLYQNEHDDSCVEHLRSLHAFRSLQAFNIKLVIQLLRVLVFELQRIKKLIESSELDPADKVTPIVRCLLPILRQYSSWLLAEVPLLVNSDPQASGTQVPPLQPDMVGIVQDLWRTYVDALATLALTYSVRAGSKSLNYLLGEDEDTIGFKPFASDIVQMRYLITASGKLKARSTDSQIVKEEPGEEMLYRARQLVKEGITIAKATEKRRMTPVRLEEGRFVYMPYDVSSSAPGSVQSQAAAFGIVIDSSNDFHRRVPSPRQATISTGMDTEMQDMVDNLVEERRHVHTEPRRPLSYHSQPISAREDPLTAADLVKRIQQPSQNLPHSRHTSSLGSISFPSGRPDTAPISHPTQSSQPFHTPAPAHQPRSSIDTSLTAQVIRQQAEIQARSSPPKTLPQPSSWSYYETPTGFNSLLNLAQKSPSVGSPLASREDEIEEVGKLPRKNLFGVIGETPGRTPTSAQPN